jgi:hypothetical protein
MGSRDKACLVCRYQKVKVKGIKVLVGPISTFEWLDESNTECPMSNVEVLRARSWGLRVHLAAEELTTHYSRLTIHDSRLTTHD